MRAFVRWPCVRACVRACGCITCGYRYQAVLSPEAGPLGRAVRDEVDQQDVAGGDHLERVAGRSLTTLPGRRAGGDKTRLQLGFKRSEKTFVWSSADEGVNRGELSRRGQKAIAGEFQSQTGKLAQSSVSDTSTCTGITSLRTITLGLS